MFPFAQALASISTPALLIIGIASAILILGATVRYWLHVRNSLHAATIFAEEPGRRHMLWQGTFCSRPAAERAAKQHVDRYESMGDVYSETPCDGTSNASSHKLAA